MNDRNKTVHMGDHVLLFEDSPDPGEVFLEKARLELRETPSVREEALIEFKQKIENTEDFELPYSDDTYLLGFLRSCKFYVDSAYEKLLRSFRLREKNAKYFTDLNPKKEYLVFENNIFTVLPYRDQEGRRTLIVEIGKKWNPKSLSLLELARGIVLIIEAAQLEPKTQISGVNIILDMEGLSLTHVWQFSPSFAKFLLDFIQDNLPLRVKSVHVINQPYLFNMLFSIFKPFIQQKLRERIFFHGTDMASLTEHIEPKILPTQYGGILELQFIYSMEIHKLICEYQDKIDEVNARGFISKKKSDKKK